MKVNWDMFVLIRIKEIKTCIGFYYCCVTHRGRIPIDLSCHVPVSVLSKEYIQV